MMSCPYRYQYCSGYLEKAHDLSDNLADRIEDFYCNGDYISCSRFWAAKEGGLWDHPEMPPWSRSDARHSQERV